MGFLSDRQHDRGKSEDSWVGIYWRPAAAVIYLFICVFDFVAVPTYLGLGGEPLKEIILAVKDLPSDTQTIVLNHKLSSWEPLTLKGGGLFHVAFGAILGATVWSRGQERINEIRRGWPQEPQYDTPPNNQAPYNPQPYPPYDPNINNNVQNNNMPRGGAIDNPDQN